MWSVRRLYLAGRVWCTFSSLLSVLASTGARGHQRTLFLDFKVFTHLYAHHRLVNKHNLPPCLCGARRSSHLLTCSLELSELFS